jgi:ATPase subunit of ABC transporter with duplicated ATPase domains
VVRPAGNYDTFMKTVAENEVVQMKKYQKEQEDIKHIKEFIASCGERLEHTAIMSSYPFATSLQPHQAGSVRKFAAVSDAFLRRVALLFVHTKHNKALLRAAVSAMST